MSDAQRFFENPVLNSPYERPGRHWELDERKHPTGRVEETRRGVSFITPIPRAMGAAATQTGLIFGETARKISTGSREYDLQDTIVGVRSSVEEWREDCRRLDSTRWKVTTTTARLLKHWRDHKFLGYRPFFCQLEAVETAIWLTEVAPRAKRTRAFLEYLDSANRDFNSGLPRLCLKMATGAGKTTVMAMIIAWQTLNSVRSPRSPRFTRSFLVVTPGITIRDHLQVLRPEHRQDLGRGRSFYRERELVPSDLIRDLRKAKVVITNYHGFLHREKVKTTKAAKDFLRGRSTPSPTVETEGEMLRRVVSELMSSRNVMVINDEAHHCYQEVRFARGTKDAKENVAIDSDATDAARVWFRGIQAVHQRVGVSRVFDLSATPFFIGGSGIQQGTLFPWTMSDFSLLDAIESGIVKLPRVPVADNAPGQEPVFRNLWKHVGSKLPQGNQKTSSLDPTKIPAKLQSALEALYGHYDKTFHQWKAAGIGVPPCFIVVCNNMATSKLVYDYVAGFHRTLANGSTFAEPGRLELFDNFCDGQRRSRPRTLLIDSRRLESGEELDRKFRDAFAHEIARFHQRRIQLTGRQELPTAAELLREAVNTVGQPGRLGSKIRCVVSVAMLTEGWDARNVTHILGIRAFGTQLLCEQVVGRALRRQSYELNERERFDPEYAHIFGIPFDFAAEPVVKPPKPPKRVVVVKAISPTRDSSEIVFPRVTGYRMKLPDERIRARFTSNSTFELTPDLVGPGRTTVRGIVGAEEEFSVDRRGDVRAQWIHFCLAKRLAEDYWQDGEGNGKLGLFPQLKDIVARWMAEHLVCLSGTKPHQLAYYDEAQVLACEKIVNGIRAFEGECPSRRRSIEITLDSTSPEGSTMHVHFVTRKDLLWRTRPDRCHVNWAVCDSKWEMEFCRVVESHPRVLAYVKNQGLGFEIPYTLGGVGRRYVPDFILLVNDGLGSRDLLRLVVEIKGIRDAGARAKAEAAKVHWIPGVNGTGRYGRWAFAEFTDVTLFEQSLTVAFDEFVCSHRSAQEIEAAKGLAKAGGSGPDMEYIPRRRSEVSE